ncbi:MAG: lipid-binding SYLF domain-containing protein [Planctomycetota bacterium]
MRRSIAALLTFALLTAAQAHAGPRENETVRQATVVLQEVMNTPGKGIPQNLLSSAQAVAIVPQLKGGAFVVGVRRGHGVMTTRDAAGNWQAPQFVTITGGSVGWQAGVQSTDVVLVLRSKQSVENLMSGKLTIGADASVAAGPVGRKVSAGTDVPLSSEIYTYSRSRGVFLGVSLDGSVLKPDPAAEAAFYQNGVVGADTTQAQQLATGLLNSIAQYSGSGVAPIAAAPATPIPAETALLDAWQKLSAILPPAWQQHLAVPAAGAETDPTSYRAALALTLTRYDEVAANPQYQALTATAEFHAVRTELMRALRATQPAAPAALQLPPPPAGSQASQPRTRLQ